MTLPTGKTAGWIIFLCSAAALILALLSLHPSVPSTWKTTNVAPTASKPSSTNITPTNHHTTNTTSTKMSPLPPLPRAIFNNTLHNSILSHWFAGLSPTSTSVDPTTASRWYGMGTPADRAAFDAQCRDIAGDALDALGPTRYPLPAWRGFRAEREDARGLSAGLRNAIWRDDGEEVALEGQDGVAGEGDAARKTHRASEKARSLVLLLDQFSRNVFRDAPGQALVYSHYDRLGRALAHSIVGVDGNGDGGVADAGEGDGVAMLDVGAYAAVPARRSWFYMPFMHSEDLADHALYRERMESCRSDYKGDAAAEGWIDRGLGYDAKHTVILERFGRYPHRNEVLGREPTPEERKWEEAGGENFGTK